MKSICIRNLRCLEDTGTIDLKPITVLVGENSSGKSTFLRTFPLLRQSVETKKTGPLLWFGKYVDFGGFDESVNRNSKEKEICFEFEFENPKINFRYSPSTVRFSSEKLPVKIRLVLMKDSKFESIVKTCEFFIGDNSLFLEFTSESKVLRFLVNGMDFSSQLKNATVLYRKGPIPIIYSEERSEKADSQFKMYSPPSFHYEMEELVRNYVDSRTSLITIHAIISKLEIGTTDNMLQRIRNVPTTVCKSWNNTVKNWDLSNPVFLEFRNKLLAYSITSLMISLDEEFSSTAENIKYIAPVRATAERYYRYQNLSVDEVDFQGQNLAMFLRDLSETERRKFSEWTNGLFGFSPVTTVSQGHVSIELIQGNQIRTNLADMGFGFSQVLPILTQLWQLSQKNNVFPRNYRASNQIIFAVEQPELHLHPRMQGKLAYAFSRIVEQSQNQGIDLRLIIETHSEALVNTFGRMVATNKLNREDISLVIFEKNNLETTSKVYVSNFDENGFLQDWPYGFFDPELE